MLPRIVLSLISRFVSSELESVSLTTVSGDLDRMDLIDFHFSFRTLVIVQS